MGKALIYPMLGHAAGGDAESSENRGDPPPPTSALMERWAFVDGGGDRKAIGPAKALLKQYEGWSPFDMVRVVLSELRERPLPAFVVRPYYEEWVGWGVDADILALALARVAMKADVKDPLRLLHSIIKGYVLKMGLVTNERGGHHE